LTIVAADLLHRGRGTVGLRVLHPGATRKDSEDVSVGVLQGHVGAEVGADEVEAVIVDATLWAWQGGGSCGRHVLTVRIHCLLAERYVRPSWRCKRQKSESQCSAKQSGPQPNSVDSEFHRVPPITELLGPNDPNPAEGLGSSPSAGLWLCG